MKRCGFVAGIGLALAVGLLSWLHWRQGVPRRSSLEALSQLNHALQSQSRDEFLATLVLPATLRSRTSAEQIEFLVKTLCDELSAEGLVELKRQAVFGPLKELFPAEAGAWAAQAGVKPEDCVAFKLERNGLRAEVVLLRSPDQEFRVTDHGTAFRVVRCNNVKQMAQKF